LFRTVHYDTSPFIAPSVVLLHRAHVSAKFVVAFC